MASPTQNISLPKSPTQLSSVPKLFRPLPRATESISINKSLSPARGTLNLHSVSSSNIKLSLGEVSETSHLSQASKKLTAFKSWHARQKRKVTSIDPFFGHLFSKLWGLVFMLFSAFFGGIKAIILFVYRAFKDIFEIMFEYVYTIFSKIMPLYPDKWFQLCSWLPRPNILKKEAIADKISKRNWSRPALWLKKPLTLVLDLDETLIHSSKVKPTEGDFDTMMIVNRDGICQQIYLRKRPFLNEFLEKAAREFNVVIFTASRMEYADTIIDFIDQDYVISRRLYRDSCSKTPTGWIKDLAKIEPDLRRVILLDNCRAASTLQPENHLLIKSWFYDETDKSLLHYLDFLIECAKKWKTEDVKVKDLRKYLKDFS